MEIEKLMTHVADCAEKNIEDLRLKSPGGYVSQVMNQIHNVIDVGTVEESLENLLTLKNTIYKKDLSDSLASIVDEIGEIHNEKCDEISNELVKNLSEENIDDKLYHAALLSVLFNQTEGTPLITAAKNKLLTGKLSGRKLAKLELDSCLFPELNLIDSSKVTMDEVIEIIRQAGKEVIFNVKDLDQEIVDRVGVSIPILDARKICGYTGPRSELFVLTYPEGERFCLEKNELRELMIKKSSKIHKFSKK